MTNAAESATINRYGVLTLPSGYTIGTRRDGGSYIGALRHGRTIVVECGHRHANRDVSSRRSGESATDCIRMVVKGAANDQIAQTRAEQYRTAWQSLTTGGGFAVTKTLVDGVKHDGARNAVAYLAAVETVREQCVDRREA